MTTSLERPKVNFVQRALEAWGIATAYGLVLWNLWAAVAAVAAGREEAGELGVERGVAVAIAVAAGYLLADFASGFVHWTFDRFFHNDTFFLGKAFVFPFREHHTDPIEITRHGFLETNGNNCLVTIPFLVVLTLFDVQASLFNLFFVTMVAVGAVGTFATNQFHKWAHDKDAPSWVMTLQKLHFILPRDHHQIHHTRPYATHFCITTGWMNALLGRLRFFERLEDAAELGLGISVFRDGLTRDEAAALQQQKKQLTTSA